MNKESIRMLFELIVGLAITFAIISNVLGVYSWIAWLVGIVFLIYKLSKERFDFW